jgi:DnaJ-class molecular chaperone
MHSPVDTIAQALEILELPKLITKEDIKKQYHFLAKKHHPDLGGDIERMEKINEAYRTLMKYIEEFRYTFDEEEISKQFPEVDYVKQHRP